MKTSVISLISYDAEYLLESIPKYYNYVDEIVLGLDEDRISWNNNPFSFDEELLFDSLISLDIDNKISIVEDNFHKHKDPMQNDNYERNFLKNECTNDLILSFDADEVLLNASEFFIEYMPIAERYTHRYDICMSWVTPYKVIDDTVLLISEKDNTPFFRENQGISARKDSEYVYARWTDKSASGENRLASPLIALHWSMARSQEQLKTKLDNTGHAPEYADNPIYKLWDSVTLENYQSITDFKTTDLGPLQWPKLTAIPKQFLEQHILQFINEAY